jgi:pyruvate dehydrogenase E1 component alpha subunit
MNEQDLIDFEKDIADNYLHAKIRGPCHFSGGNEKQLLKIFEDVKKHDWVFSTHRSHYHALLKSEDPEWLKKQIFLKRSSHINSKKYRIFTSAIVGGILPIAVGVALDIKRKGGKEKVWCFIGDMASEMGIFNECWKYAMGEDLPITFIIEDNRFGCYTPTKDVWKTNTEFQDPIGIKKYIYERTYPHYGLEDKEGKKIWINF